ncbi:hypothetical protein DNTS_032790, partial [Danionella cerebrum]
IHIIIRRASEQLHFQTPGFRAVCRPSCRTEDPGQCLEESSAFISPVAEEPDSSEQKSLYHALSHTKAKSPAVPCEPNRLKL